MRASPTEPLPATGQAQSGSGVGDPLERLRALAAEGQAEGVADDAQRLIERVSEGRFFVACLGQFKRGKSTLINALLDEPILPCGVAPVTSVVTVVRHGGKRARVRFGNSVWRDIPVEDIGLYVSERENPQNQKEVSGIEVFCPSPFLERGLCLVDTPGIGSVFAGNTAETRAFVPHIDAALIVLGGDPPITGDELEIVESVCSSVANVIVLLNKADRLAPDELNEAHRFTETLLTARLSKPVQVLEISALERLQTGRATRDWSELTRQLERLASDGGAELVARAAVREAGILVTRLRRQFNEERDALVRPVEESEQRLQNLRRCAANAEQSLVELSHLLNAEQERLMRRFDDDRDRFVKCAVPELVRQLDEHIEHMANARPQSRSRQRRDTIETAAEIAEAQVRAWMESERNLAEAAYAAVTQRFAEQANAFLDRLRHSGEFPEGALPPALIPETGLRARSRFHFGWFMHQASPSLWTWLADRFRRADSRRASTRKAAIAFAEHSLEANANRVVNDFYDRMVESRRSVESALRRTLREVVGCAERAAERASLTRREGAAAIHAELDRIERQIVLLAEIAAEFDFGVSSEIFRPATAFTETEPEKLS